MEKGIGEALSGMRIAESHIVPDEVDETNDLNSHDFYRKLANKFVMERDKESYNQLNDYIKKGSRLAVAYDDYINYVLATQELAIYPRRKNAEDAYDSLSAGLPILIETASKYSKCIEPVACMLAKTLLTKQEWDLYYFYLLPHVLRENPNPNLIDLFNRGCCRSEKGLERITSRVLKLCKTQENPEELAGLVELSKQYIDIYCNHQKHTNISSGDVTPSVSSQDVNKYQSLKNHQLDECYSKIKTAGILSYYIYALGGTDVEKKTKAKQMLDLIRGSQTYKTYDPKNSKDEGYLLRLIDTKPEKLCQMAQNNRDKKDPLYAVDCYSVAAGKLKNYKKAIEVMEKTKNNRNYIYCRNSIKRDLKIDFSKFEFEYYLAQRDYLMEMYCSNGVGEAQVETKQVQVKSQETKSVKATVVTEDLSALQEKKRDLKKKKRSLKTKKNEADKNLSRKRDALLEEQKKLENMTGKLAKLEDEVRQVKVQKSTLESDTLRLQKKIDSTRAVLDERNSFVGGNESGEVTVIKNTTPITPVNEIDSTDLKPKMSETTQQRKERKTIDLKSSKKHSPLTRRNSMTNLEETEKPKVQNRDRKPLTRTQSVVELRSQNNFEEASNEKEKKDKKSRKSNNNSKNNANPNRALKLHQAEKKLVRKNSQQNLILNSEWESESELSVAEGDSKNLYVQEGKRDTDLKVLKKLLNDRDLILPSDVKLTDSKVRRILRDLAHRNIISWSGQRPESKDEKITATHHQNPDICLTIHLHGHWWANPAIKEHFMNFVRQCDAEIDSMMTEIENRKMKK